ncbi:MAG: hypothetical protein LN409_03130 [Candidatus Thermoplasmatota archaeon]|nr:hypothetical protein [Candidatus Thermoplasmatota archaeon]
MMMTDSVRRGDVPRLVGAVGARAPGIVIRLGLSYLKHKKGSQKATRTFVRSLEENGVPPHLAMRLGEAYGSELSVRKLIDSGGTPLLRKIGL